MFWKVASYAQPSPIEQILDKDGYTLEELLDEDDIIQECKALNGRLLVFLKTKSTVEQLLRYLVEPANDCDDPKRQYKFPFTACEVFCCELEAVFTTLLEHEDLMAVLFSLLDAPPPLNSKTAGYFGRVVGHLLMRKPNDVMQYLHDHQDVLTKLIGHVDTTSVADIFKRVVGADEQTSLLFQPHHMVWLSDTPLLEMLLERLSPAYSAEVKTNAADILCAIAHTQPSPLASKLMAPAAVQALLEASLNPEADVLVPALDVVISLLQPRRRRTQEQLPDSGGSPAGSSSSGGPPGFSPPFDKARNGAITALLPYIAPLVTFLKDSGASRTQETPFGLLSPPLGRSKLKIAELLAALLRADGAVADQAIIEAGAVQLCMQLFVAYPFNNLLHQHVRAMFVAVLGRNSQPLLQHLFTDCGLLDWIASMPREVTPLPRPGNEDVASRKAPLRAGYLGHVTQIANMLIETASMLPALNELLAGDESWQSFVQQVLSATNEVENVTQWACGRPVVAELGGIDQEGDEYQNDLDLEQMAGMQPALYHRYGALDDMDEEEEEEDRAMLDSYSPVHFGTSMLTDAMAHMDLNDSEEARTVEEALDGEAAGGIAGLERQMYQGGQMQGAQSHAVEINGEQSMDDDEVLLHTSDEDDDRILEEPHELHEAAWATAAAGTEAAAADNGGGVAEERSAAGAAAADTETRAAAPVDSSSDVPPPSWPEDSLMQTGGALRSGAPATAAPAGEPQPGEVTKFNDYQYWRPSMPFDVPDEL